MVAELEPDNTEDNGTQGVERGVIKPCPFCRASAETTTMTFGDSMTEYYRVECEEGDALDCWDDTEEEAIATWNKRAV